MPGAFGTLIDRRIAVLSVGGSSDTVGCRAAAIGAVVAGAV